MRIFDESKALEFYHDFLGFEVDWQHRFEEGMPLYLQISKGPCVLHLSAHDGDGCPGASPRIETSGLEDFQKLLIARNYPFCHPGLEPKPWGTREVTISDPFGNRLAFYEAIAGDEATAREA